MKKLISITVATLLIAGLSAAPASAKHRKHHGNPMSRATGGMMSMRGNNAELMGNNGNSGQGSNSLGHIQGGNIGGGK